MHYSIEFLPGPNRVHAVATRRLAGGERFRVGTFTAHNRETATRHARRACLKHAVLAGLDRRLARIQIDAP